MRIKAWARKGSKSSATSGDKHGLPVVTEVMDPRRVEMVAEYADMIQIGARNMQNFVLLTEVGQHPQAGAAQARHERHDRRSADERRIHPVARQSRTSCSASGASRASITPTRNLFDVAAVPACKALSHLPIIVDPSHATGRPDLIPACALAGVAAGADGVHIEVHNCPEEAMSDGPQALLPEQYAEWPRRFAEVGGIVRQDDLRG